MPVLNFPQRYMLLSKAWAFPAAANAILAAMVGRASGDELEKLEHQVQRWRDGANAKLKPNVILSYIKNLAAYFDANETLKSRGVSKDVFVAEIRSQDDMAFIDFLSRTSVAPRLVGVLSRDKLKGMLTTNQDRLVDAATREKVYFFYRLGFNAGASFKRLDDKLKFVGNKKAAQEAILVIRRIPARLRLLDADADHLIYEEHYIDELDPKKSKYTSIAAAYVYEQFLTIVSKDLRETDGGVTYTEASMAQVDLKEGYADKRWFPGVVTMRSDCTPHQDRWDPTAYRFVLRPAPADVSWDEEEGKKCAKNLSRTVRVADFTGDMKIDAFDFKSESDDGIDSPQTWAELVHRLQVSDNIADLVVANGSGRPV